MNIPNDLRYTKDHEWIRLDGAAAVIGITEFAVEQLGDITLIEAPQKGAKVNAGDAVGTIESVKAVSDLYSPISGTVVEINEDLNDAPEKVNADPYGEGWMLKIKPADPGELDKLLDASAYGAHLKSLEG